ncbi:omptin family outer membrane protease [uncultured Treponema sp.]|uniref:omptin family outer membrane protease n=1 Tax=uncultured Treponema sp. TaxID=162155 RepID=UPI0025E28062|nr:omptin family outer membrane protease [uncultured Treponema sp.]
MKSRFFLAFFSFLPIFSFAEIPLHFSLEPYFAYSQGQINELLYDEWHSGRILSSLEWDRNLFLIGVDSACSFGRLNLSVDFSSSVPQDSGNMQDSDWMNQSAPQMRTTYSCGTNEAVQNYDTNLSLSFDFFPFNSADERVLVFSPMAQVQYAYDSFERTKAKGWYGQGTYSSDSKNHWWYEEEAKRFPVTYWNDSKGRYVTQRLAGVSFSQHIFSTFIGAKIAARVSKRLSFDFSALFSPFSYTEFTDTHHGSETRYSHAGRNFWKQAKYSFGGDFAFSKRLSLNLSGSIFSFQRTKGTFYIDGIKDYAHKNGTGRFSMTAKAGIRVKVL